MKVSSSTRRHVHRTSLASTAVLALVSVTGCTAGSPPPDDPGSTAAPQVAPDEPRQDTTPVTFEHNVDSRAVSVDTRVTVESAGGTIEEVRLTRGAGQAVAGSLDDDATTWTAGQLLEPGKTYRLVTTGVSDSGQPRRRSERFRTEDLTLDQQTYPSVAPLDGATVGVGMPLIVTFDVPVEDRAAAERHLDVTSTPRVKGTWHWLSDTEVHFRPRRYWPAGAEVRLEAQLNSVDVGGGIYGQESAASTSPSAGP